MKKLFAPALILLVTSLSGCMSVPGVEEVAYTPRVAPKPTPDWCQDAQQQRPMIARKANAGDPVAKSQLATIDGGLKECGGSRF